MHIETHSLCIVTACVCGARGSVWVCVWRGGEGRGVGVQYCRWLVEELGEARSDRDGEMEANCQSAVMQCLQESGATHTRTHTDTGNCVNYQFVSSETQRGMSSAVIILQYSVFFMFGMSASLYFILTFSFFLSSAFPLTSLLCCLSTGMELQ